MYVKKQKKSYVCQNCGVAFGKWRGCCEECQQWDTLVLEEPLQVRGGGTMEPLWELLTLKDEVNFQRLSTDLPEVDRVLGGGLVAGSVCLMSGEPGIGKSTLLLQLAHNLHKRTPVIYVSGEESGPQIRLRARRLRLDQATVHLFCGRLLNPILTQLPPLLAQTSFPGFLIIDSIQTLMIEGSSAIPGSLSQIRDCMNALIHLAKTSGVCIMIVGHVTKDGLIAGPKLLEHMVDAVLSFEGDCNQPYRLLRTLKNRFGPSQELCVLDMTKTGLKEVKNPSSLFLSQRRQNREGACIFAGMQGTRPLLLECQALTVPSFFNMPQRSVVGWDLRRLSMLLAVLEARCKLNFSKRDVFLTVLGGLKLEESTADLAVALALISCLKKKPLPQDMVALGEIGLTGEIYCPAFIEARLREAKHMGFRTIIGPIDPSLVQEEDLLILFVDDIKKLDLLLESNLP